MDTVTGRYWKTVDETRVQCTLCPNMCVIRDGRTGVCGVRTHRDGTLTLPFFGRLSAIALDPIEKKPLYHFHPGESILSIGFLGCSLRCPFCQNYTISQSTGARTEAVSPEELVQTARNRGSFGIAYTYNEPTIHAEYVLDSAACAGKAGLKNVLVTAGYVGADAARDILSVIDAVNVDLKGFKPEFYANELGAKLEPVKEFIRRAADSVHLEVTTLVIPGKNDDDEEVEAMAAFLAGLNPDIPYHLSAYYPTYKYTREATTPQSVAHLKAVAERHLTYVYPGNVRGEANTRCPGCGYTVVWRRGYTVDATGLSGETCAHCGRRMSIVTD